MKQSQICLWFDSQALEAAQFYTSIFEDGKIYGQDEYVDGMQEINGKEPGDIVVVEFYAAGINFMGLNGGPHFTFNEAVSVVINCETQEEVDMYWNALIADGGKESMCGWLKDKYGLSWQIIPVQLNEFMKNGDETQRKRVNDAMLKMNKLDVTELQKAYENK